VGETRHTVLWELLKERKKVYKGRVGERDKNHYKSQNWSWMEKVGVKT